MIWKATVECSYLEKKCFRSFVNVFVFFSFIKISSQIIKIRIAQDWRQDEIRKNIVLVSKIFQNLNHIL